MTGLDILKHASLYIFTAFYLTCFRGSLKTATSWGAFELRIDAKKLLHKFFLSASFLVVVPILIYCLVSQIITVLSPELVDFSNTGLLLIAQISLMCIIMLFLSLFPLATKHLWCVIAQKQFDSGWFNKDIDQKKLPLACYSWQVIILAGIIPITLSVMIIILYGNPTFSGTGLFLKLYWILYISQFTVLYSISKQRGYFYHKRQYIMSKRMLLTLTATIVTPVVFGVLISPLFLYILSRISDIFSLYEISLLRTLLNWLLIISLFVYLFLSLPFPYFMNQSLLLLAKKNKWTQRPEIKDESPKHWNRCFLLACFCILGYVILYFLNVIDYTLIVDNIEKLEW